VLPARNRASDFLSFHFFPLAHQVRIVKHSFEIISLLTDQNPVQTLVDAIINR
jgi:hypothetical protein